MRVNLSDDTTLKLVGINEGTKIHVQNHQMVSLKGKLNDQIFLIDFSST